MTRPAGFRPHRRRPRDVGFFLSIALFRGACYAFYCNSSSIFYFSMPKSQQPKSAPQHNPFDQMEQEIIGFWEENRTFEQSVETKRLDKQYAFYDGPPFATGLPHYGHIVASLMKDMVPRFWTMRGFRVERKWGWDCHGLPIENIIEKELNLPSRKDIEAYGVDKFNEACRATVLTYAEEWKKVIRRIGRWVDMENDYKTMDAEYMESVWWVFNELWKKKLIYEGHKVMHICPRCVTPLSNFEVTQGYKEVKDISAYPQFKLVGAAEKLDVEGDVYAVAWTTTPWTLPGNVLLAVGADIDYILYENKVISHTSHGDESIVLRKPGIYVFAKDQAKKILEKTFSHRSDIKEYVRGNISIEQVEGYVKIVKGKELENISYEPLFPYFAQTPNAFRVVTGDFVSTADGSGIVHIAPAFGEDDYQLGKRHDIQLVQHVTMDGVFVPEVTDFAGQQVKPKDDPTHTDIEIIKWLAHNGKLFAKEKITHTYPHCWRCDTPLLNYATSSWFVRVTELKEQLLKNNQTIHWVPEHIKDGRFGKWLEGARDWAISRTRFWGAPLPVWRSEDGDVICISSVAELEELSGKKVPDIHKHFVDEIVITRNGKEYRRIPEVFDCWFESGSMPYAQMHYPFENRSQLEAGFPAEFIAEGQDQTRGWFYTLHVLATALTLGDKPSIPVQTSTPAFRNVIVNGLVMAEDGKKMSKKLKNYPDPMEVVARYGADTLRFYLASSPVMEGENLNFSENDLAELYRKYTNTLWNVFTFYKMFADQEQKLITAVIDPAEVTHVMDKWILSKLQTLTQEVTQGYETYRLRQAAFPLVEFVQELSTWYVRRCRDRFKGEDAVDRLMALRTLYTVLKTLTQLAAPVTPFITEKIYQELRTGNDALSVHLTEWPDENEAFINQEVLKTMQAVREAIEKGLSLRSEVKIKVRQPLQSFTVIGETLHEQFQEVMRDELNVKEIKFGAAFELETALTPDLKREGLLRELIRQTNALRKKEKLSIGDRVTLKIQTESALIREVLEKHAAEYQAAVLATELQQEATAQSHKCSIDGETVTISLVK